MIGVSEPTVRRARDEGASPDAPERIGMDGKVYHLPVGGELVATMREYVTKARMAPLDLLYAESCGLAERAANGELPFLSAIDLAYGVAVMAGLCETEGDDTVQDVLATAFMGVPRTCSQ